MARDHGRTLHATMRARVILLALGLAVALGTAEAALRVLRPQNTLARLMMNEPAMFRPSDLLPYELRPGYVGRLKRREFDIAIRINRQGYRSPEFSPDAKERVRILAVGDSFTFGWGVEAEDAYPQRLERLLAARLGGDVEVINAGFAAGYSPDSYYLYLATRGLLLNPDLVIVGFFVGNDIDFARAFENEWTEVDEEGLPLRITNVDAKVDQGWWVSRRRPLRYDVPILRDVHLFQLAAGALSRIGGRRPSSSEHSAADEVPFVFRTVYEERTRRFVDRARRLFQALHRISDRRGVPLVILLIPDRVQFAAARNARAAGADWEKPQRIFRAFFDEDSIPYVDLLDDMRARASPGAFYFPTDLHWNREGHALAARQLAEYVLQERLLPEP